MITLLLVREKNRLLWKRLVAFGIDVFIVSLITSATLMLSPWPISKPFSQWVLYGIWMIYSVLFEYFSKGTPGKHLMRLAIVYAFDERPYLLSVLYRNFLKIFFYIDFLWMLGAPYRQGVHNQVAKCTIVEQTK